MPPIVHDVLRSPGDPLDAATRSFMEPRFGHDFSQVRVHADARGAESARAVNAVAYTVGRDVVFGAGQYAPWTSSGQRLLAHELAHVVQQGGGPVSGSVGLRLNPPEDHFEQEADRIADALAATPVKGLPRIVDTNGPARLSRNPPSLQRKANFVKGTVSEEINPAEQIGENKVPSAELFLGRTDFKLNSANLTVTAFEKAVYALHRPRFGSTSRADKGVDCTFSSEPENEGSYEMKLLKQGTWTFQADRAKLKARFPKLAKSCDKAGTVPFTVRGEDSDATLRKKIKTHEEQHASDYKTIFDNSVVPWDKGVTKAFNNKLKTAAENSGKCEEALYSAQGVQTPKEVVKTVVDEINAKAATFHASPDGSKPTVSFDRPDSGCERVIARVE